MNNQKIYFCSVALVLTLLAFFMFLFTPHLHDDAFFLEGLQGFFNGECSRWSSIITEYVKRYQIDTGRIANLVGIILLSYPKWVEAVFFALCVGATIVGGAKVIGVWGHSLLAYAVFIAGFLYLPAWYEYMYMTMYAVNYVTSSALFVWILYLILRRPKMNIVIAIASGIFMAVWHELFGAMLFAAVIALNICFKNYRTPAMWCMAFAILIGTFINFFSPGVQGRHGNLFMLADNFNIYRGLLNGLPYYTLCIATVAGLLIESLRARFLTPALTSIVAAGLAAWVVWRMYFAFSRTAWGVGLAAALGIAYIVGVICTNRSKLYDTIGWILISVVTLHQAAVIPFFCRMYHSYDVGARYLDNNPLKDSYYVDYDTEMTSPLVTLNRPNASLFTKAGTSLVKAVPAALADFNPDNAVLLPKGQKAYLYNNMIVGTDVPYQAYAWRAKIYFDNGKELVVCATARPFDTASGRYYFISPEAIFSNTHTCSVSGIELLYEDVLL